MRFYMTAEAAGRLGLNVDRICYAPNTGPGPDGERPVREFSGPSLREGLMGGFPRGVIGWAKKALKVQRVEQLDVVESRLLYYVITMRSADHTLLPVERFDDLALTDFELVQHVVPFLDRDGDCGECSMMLDHPVHLDVPDADVLPPTTGPGSPETTGMATG